MSELKHKQFKTLVQMDRAPIDLPAEIYFAGNVKAQRSVCTRGCPDGKCICTGRHHLPKYQKTGTYWLKELCQQRLRDAQDHLNRLMNGKSSDAENRDMGSDIHTCEARVSQLEKEYQIVLAGGIPGEVKPAPVEQPAPVEEVTTPVSAMPSIGTSGSIPTVQAPTFEREEAPVAKKAGRPKKAEAIPADDGPEVDPVSATFAANSSKSNRFKSGEDTE